MFFLLPQNVINTLNDLLSRPSVDLFKRYMLTIVPIFLSEDIDEDEYYDHEDMSDDEVDEDYVDESDEDDDN